MNKGVLCLQSDMHYCYWITCINCMHTLQAVPGYHPKGVYAEGEQCKQKYRGCTYVERYVGMIIEKWAEWENETLKGEHASVLLNSCLLVDWQVFWISCGTVTGNSMDEWSLWEDPWRLPGWDSRHTVKKRVKIKRTLPSTWATANYYPVWCVMRVLQWIHTNLCSGALGIWTGFGAVNLRLWRQLAMFSSFKLS